MQNVPGYNMAAEPYTLTPVQIEALNALPPGLYLVCSVCRKFSPTTTTLSFNGEGFACDRCVRGL